MTAKINRSEFIATFKSEVEEHLANLNKGLVTLEKSPKNTELLKELFRTAHTLKGVARMMGFFEIQEIAHRIEDIFGAIGDERLKFNSEVLNKIFKGLDIVKDILVKIVKDQKIDIDITAVCSELALDETTLSHAKRTKQPTKKTKIKKDIEQLEPVRVFGREAEQNVAQANQDNSVAQEQQHIVEEYVRVSLSRVSKLLNLVGEMVINKIKTSQKLIALKKISKLAKNSQKRLAYFFEEFKNNADFQKNEKYKMFLDMLHQCNVDAEKIKEEMLAIFENISNEAIHMDPIIDELQERMKEIRMLPCFAVFDDFPRLVRDISQAQSKKVNLVITGEDTELDKKVLEGIKAPLMHILRNCVDHGIETPKERISKGKKEEGTIKVSASQEGGHVVIRIEDDGKGLDIEKIRDVLIKKGLCPELEVRGLSDEQVSLFIFKSGFSTSPLITDISGRGVGLDVVQTQIDKLKGKVSVEFEKDKGTKITLELPLTIAIIDVLLVRVSEKTFALPMLSIEEVLEIDHSGISTVENKMAIQVRDHTVPLAHLSDILGLFSTVEEEQMHDQKLSVIIATSLDKRVGFIVDGVIGEQEVFIKSLGAQLRKVRNVAGATVLGTGEVIVILDVADLIASSRMAHSALTPQRSHTKEDKATKKILVVEDSLTTRELERHILESQGYSVDTAIDGLEGLDKLAQSKYNLVVCDIQMPRMDGFEFCQAFRRNKKYKEIPLIFVTALAKEEDKRRGIEVGAQAYIVKTAFDQANLVDTVSRLVG